MKEKTKKITVRDPFSLLLKLKELALLDKIPVFREVKILAQDPIKTQERVLKEIIKKNAKTKYGRKYKFNKIKTIEDFQKLPIIKFPDIKEYVEEIKQGKKNILGSKEVIYFATTSGTTSEPKYIPVTKLRMKLFTKQLLMWGYYVAGKNMKTLKGKTLYFAGTDLCGYTEGGNIPHGNISGYIIKNLPWYAKKRLVVPWEVYRINDFERRTRMIALLALKSDVTQILFAEPIEAIIFFDYLKEHKEELIRELRILGYKKVAKQLEKKEFIPTEIWPHLNTINCIKTHMNGIYLDKLKEKLGPKELTIRDPGIYSSEAGISLCITNEGSYGVPLYNAIFFEFLEQPEKKGQKPVTIDKVEEGKQYKIILTNPEGLYRYNLEDVVEVVGFKRKVPLIQFVNRSKFIDIAGEKCPESEVVKAVKKGLEKSKIKVKAYTVIPHVEDLGKRPKYEILLEGMEEIETKQAKEFLKTFDEELQKLVIDYENMRNEYGRIDLPILSILKKGSYDAFEKKRVLTTGQPKIINVSRDPKFKNNFTINKTISIK